MSAEVVVVSGTGTGVGKTWVTARVVDGFLRRGLPCTARKPVQSFDPDDGPTDAEMLAAATGENPHWVTPSHRWYPLPMAPPMAAEALGLPPIALADLIAEMRPPDIGTVLVEGVGGPRSPLSDDADTADLAEELAARAIVLVADAGLGTINAVLLALQVFAAPVLVFLNRFEGANDLHRRNRRWLEEIEAVPCSVTIPELLGRIERTLTSPLEVR